MTDYARTRLTIAALGCMILGWSIFGLPAYLLTALGSLVFGAYVLVRFRMSWISFSGFHAAALGLVIMHALAPLAQRAEGHLVALVAVPFMAACFLFGLSPLMPSPVRRNAGEATSGGSEA